jgi:hypothetical protein
VTTVTEPLKTGIDELLTELDALVAREQSLLAALRAVGGAAAEPALTKATETLPRTFRLTTPLMAGPDVKAFQRLLNARFEAWGIHARLLEDGHFGASTRHVALGLGLESADWAHGITPSMRVLMRTPSRRSAEQLQRAQARRGWLGELRARHATAKPAPAPEASAAAAAKPAAKAAKPSPAPTAPQGLAAAILAHGGRYEEIVVREAQRSGVPASLICAVLEIETGFRNVFGYDAVANPSKSPSPPAPDLEVTRSRYRSYLQHRKAGQGNQGVGPMQLTSPDLQDRADKLGGAWRPARTSASASSCWRRTSSSSGCARACGPTTAPPARAPRATRRRSSSASASGARAWRATRPTDTTSPREARRGRSG